MGINDQSLDGAGVRGIDWPHALRLLGLKDRDGRWRWPPHRKLHTKRASKLLVQHRDT